MALTVAAEPRAGSCRSGIAWMALSLALLAHVVDEALTGFLDVYNPIVRSIRDRYGWFPMPEFRVDVWIAGAIFRRKPTSANVRSSISRWRCLRWVSRPETS